MSQEINYKTVYRYNYKFTGAEDCTIFIRYYGEDSKKALLSEVLPACILIREDKNNYIVMGRYGEEVLLPKEECEKVPWYL